jgi:hypothetical protein
MEAPNARRPTLVTVRINEDDVLLLQQIFGMRGILNLSAPEFLTMKKQFVQDIISTFPQLQHLNFGQVYRQAQFYRSKLIYRKAIGV